MGTIIGFLVTKGLSERMARVVAIGGLFVLILGAMGAGKCAYDRSVIAKHEAKREAKASAAREEAADQRANDAITNAKSEEELHHVIDNAPKGGEVSPAARALACERLRRIGRIPAACRPGSSDGIQAGSH